MGAGPRDTLITFHSVTTTENDLGEPVKSGLSQVGTAEWARVHYGLGAERRSAAIEGADQAATFSVLAHGDTRSITTKHVIQLGNEIWDIVNVVPLKRRDIEFTAVRRSP